MRPRNPVAAAFLVAAGLMAAAALLAYLLAHVY
jgi:hypothetical protein